MKINYAEQLFTTDDNIDIHYRSWLPENPKAILQVAHGMAEHSGRYKHFAEFMASNGYGVYASDHRGHGQTAKTPDRLGHLADTDGWKKAINDMHQLTTIIKENEGNTPIFLLGHSMGSLLARAYTYTYYNEINGLIISGTSGNQGLLGDIGLWIARRQKKQQASKLMDWLLFGVYDIQSIFKNCTLKKFSWISRDREIVEAYKNDDFCSFICTGQFYVDLLGGVLIANNRENLTSLPADFPILICSGDRDPVGNYGKGVKQVYNDMLAAGLRDVTCKLYKGGRHEMLNEINRESVYTDILQWLNNK